VSIVSSDEKAGRVAEKEKAPGVSPGRCAQFCFGRQSREDSLNARQCLAEMAGRSSLRLCRGRGLDLRWKDYRLGRSMRRLRSSGYARRSVEHALRLFRRLRQAVRIGVRRIGEPTTARAGAMERDVL